MYRIADNFLHLWLSLVDRYRAEIERGLGRTILPVIIDSLDDHIGPRWEEAFREHLRRLAAAGQLHPEVVAIGPFWSTGRDAVEIDAVALAGRNHRAVLLGEAKWALQVDGRKLRRRLDARAAKVPGMVADPTAAICAREAVAADPAFRSSPPPTSSADPSPGAPPGLNIPPIQVVS